MTLILKKKKERKNVGRKWMTILVFLLFLPGRCLCAFFFQVRNVSLLLDGKFINLKEIGHLCKFSTVHLAFMEITRDSLPNDE